MASKNLDNPVAIDQLKLESPDQKEFDGMVCSAMVRSMNVKKSGFSPDSRFDLAYNAAYSLTLAAVQWHGYRSDKRYLVFQCLPLTLQLSSAKTRMALYHGRCNVAGYEGRLEVTEQLLQELTVLTDELLTDVQALDSVG